MWCLAIVMLAAGPGAQARISFDEARPVLEAVGAAVPPDFRGLSLTEMAAQWPRWVARHDREVRARLARGDDDSLVNLWLYGTSFTSHPPAVARTAGGGVDVEELARRRLPDFLDGVRSPGANERLQFARLVLARRDIDASGRDGLERARRFLMDARRRMIEEFAATDRALAAAGRDGAAVAAGTAASIFRDRGLSTDTSLLPAYSVEMAMQAIARQGLLQPRQVARVAIVGPGLDFANKADAYDFYPEQSIQPFALLDTLRRSTLAAPSVRVTTFDISARVNAHLRLAPARAASAAGYVLTLPLDGTEEWTDGLLAYWRTFGQTIGEETAAAPPPPSAAVSRVRAVRLEPQIVASIEPRDLNIVLDRLTPTAGQQFDLVVATNVLVYYDVFEQALALANIAAMLRPGGLLLTNTAVLPTPPMKSSASYLRVPHSAQRYDDMFWYERDR
jgi:hypothetical protein